jgi:hypothetical protein
MYCPKCSQPLVSGETQFCSRCGLSLHNLKQILADGQTQAKHSGAEATALSPREQGMRQGVMLMLLSIILIPAYVLLASLFPANDRLVESSVSDTPFEKISQALLFTIFMTGLARALYARLFQRGPDMKASRDETGAAELTTSASTFELPPAQSIPVSNFGAWREDTGEMAQPRSHRERTTKSFNQE